MFCPQSLLEKENSSLLIGKRHLKSLQYLIDTRRTEVLPMCKQAADLL